MNRYEKNFNGKDISHNGFPHCPKCGGTICWENDYNAEDLMYNNDGIVSVFRCSHCGLVSEMLVEDDGYKLLMTQGKGKPSYTQLAKDMMND